MNHNNVRLIFLSTLIFLMAFLSGCASESKPAPSAPEAVRNIPVVTVRPSNIPDLLEAVGTVQAAQTSTLASQTVGNIVEVRVREGDRIQRGQVLAVIDDTQARAAMDRATAADSAAQQQLAAAGSELGLAESTLKRYQSLYEKKSLSPQEFDEVKARQQAASARCEMAQAGAAEAKAALTAARTSFDYTRIRAPFDGVVTEKKADPGTLASPGMAIFAVEDVRHYRLEATVNESDLRYLRIGQAVPVLIDAIDNSELGGKVAQIVPAADPASRSFMVKIELPGDRHLRSGLFGRAQFSRGERQSLLVPRTAVVERGQLQGVFVLDQQRIANLRYVTVGKPVGQQVEVLAGLQSGESLVAKPGDLDLNGKHIEAQ